jgi:threonine dehydrogenase-like Zn-dependent dehydrogenase
MNALQVVQPRSFKTVQVSVPHLTANTPGQIVVQTAWVSMCGSDIPFFTGSKRFKSYPLAAGCPIHECLGRVVESSSSIFQVGDSVIAIPEGDQGLAQFFLAQDQKAVRLPAELAESPTSCLIQPLSTVINAVDRLGDLNGRSVAVLGLGSIGLMFCWLLKQCGAGRVVGIDPLAERCCMAERFGADQTVDLRSIEVVHAARQSPTAWEAPDICVEAVGHQMDTLNDCLELVRKEGTVLAFGVPDHPVYALEYETFFRKNAHLMAVVTPLWSEYLVKARQVFAAHRPELEALFTHRFPIRQAGEAFTMYERHADGILKALLDASYW